MSRAMWSIVIALPIVALLWFGLDRNPNAEHGLPFSVHDLVPAGRNVE